MSFPSRFTCRIALLAAVLAVTLLQQRLQPADSRQPLPGQIVVDPDDPRWLKREGGAHLYICGPGDPEDFLYRGTRNPDGTRSGDQLDLINKLIRHGGNSIYLQAVRTHGGDARDDHTHNPFIDSDPAKGLAARILDQWEEWFTLMDDHEILIYFFFYDDSARIWDTGDEVGPEERTFFETIVRRFKHHRNLIWLIGEESEERYSHARVQALAAIIRDADDHGHPIGNHHLSGTLFKAWRPGGALNHFSMQFTAAGDDAHAGAIEAFRNAEGRYQVIYAESTAAPTDPGGMRRHAWAVSMGGVMPMLLRMDIASTPPALLEQCRALQHFFEATDFPTMAPHDELADAESKYVLADPGRSYIACADNLSGKLGLKGLPAGRCEITWLDCQSGRTTAQRFSFARSGDRAFDKPAGFGPECAAWIRFPDIKQVPRRSSAHVATLTPSSGSDENEPPVVKDTRVNSRGEDEVYIQLHFMDADGPGPYTYAIERQPRHGTLSGTDNDLWYKPDPGFVGADEFTWKVNDGEADSLVATVTIVIRSRVGGGPAKGTISPTPDARATPVANAGSPVPPRAVAIGKNGADGFVAVDTEGRIHVIYGGKYRSGPAPDQLGPEETIGDIDPVNGVRIAIDGAGRPHVVFTAGSGRNATRSFYTARIDGRWLPAEKFADAADFPERSRAYVADVAVNPQGQALASFWVGRPKEKRAEYENWSFYYRWRTHDGAWTAPQGLSAHWSSSTKVEFDHHTGGFFLLWQYRANDWRITGPVPAGGVFTVERSIASGSATLGLAVQNEGADFSVNPGGVLVVAGNKREKFEGPVGVWATTGTREELPPPVYLGSFPGTVRGSESGLHPVTTFDAATGHAFVAVRDPATKRAMFTVHRPNSGWASGYTPILPKHSTPQGSLRQGPSLADVPGPGVLALVSDGEQRWYLRHLTAQDVENEFP